jgi:hypothetical protein
MGVKLGLSSQGKNIGLRYILLSIPFVECEAEENVLTGSWSKRVWRYLNNEEFHNLYLAPNIIEMIKSRRMK